MNSNIHNIELKNRNKLLINGVLDVVSFDEIAVVLDTCHGRLMVDGSDLHILALDLESGEVSIEGKIDDLIYEDQTQQKKKGLFGRLIK